MNRWRGGHAASVRATRHKRSVLLLVIVLILGLISSTVIAKDLPPGAQQAHDRKIVARVEADRAIEHVRILSEVIGPRPGGTASEWQAASYIGSVLASYGYDVTYQTFPVADQYIGTITFPGGSTWQTGAASGGVMTGDLEIIGEVVYAGTGTDSEYTGDVTGKIVLLRRSGNQRNQVLGAVNRGASAVILYNTVGSRGAKGGAYNPSVGSDIPVPVLGAAQAHGEWLIDMLAQGPVVVSVRTEHHSNLQSMNVIGSRPPKGGPPKKHSDAPVVIVGAHYDSVVGAPGANDDASGVGLALELARVMKSYNTDMELRFAFWGSEERGLLGSRHYVNQLPQEEVDRIVAMFQADMVATSHPGVTHLYAMTVDGNTNLVTDAATAAGARLGNSSILPGQFGSSDHVPFHQRGVPAALFIWMRVDSWNPLVYEIEPIYHTPEDTIALNISRDRMQQALEIIGAAVFDIVRKQVPALDRSR